MNEHVEVPKRMHFVWVGGPLPDQFLDNIKNWRNKNPDYECILWIDTAATPPNEVDRAIKQAQATGATINDLNGNASRLLDEAETRLFYQDEVTGQHANYAAACDLIRLEILEVEGGVYIDVDTLPSEVPLGDIVVHEQIGFVKPPGPTNDVLASIPHSEFVHRVKQRAIHNYNNAYSGTDNAASENIELHRSKRPWKLRTETTIAWAGPDVYLETIREFAATHTDPQAQDALKAEIMPESIQAKFKTESAQTWRDKGPKNIQESRMYFKEEFAFRLRNHFIKEVQGLKDKSNDERLNIALTELQSRLQKSSDTTPLNDIINSWQKSLPPDLKISFAMKVMINQLKSAGKSLSNIDCSNLSLDQIIHLKGNLFPNSHYIFNDQGESVLDKGMKSGIDSYKQIKDLLKHQISREHPFRPAWTKLHTSSRPNVAKEDATKDEVPDTANRPKT